MYRFLVLLVGLLLLAAPTAAEVQLQRAPQVARPPGAAIAVDPQAVTAARINQLTAKVKNLQNQVSGLQSQVKDFGARQISFQCVDPRTSSNNRGASEDCWPYACEAVQGVCRTQCTSSDQCVGGTVCDIPNRLCVVP